MAKKKFPWKKSFRSIPDVIKAKVEEIAGELGRVGCVKKIRHSVLVSGLYSHLGIQIRDGNLHFQPSVLPPASVGRSSRRNRTGFIIIHTDRPKVDKTIYLGERPVFGDWSKGSFPLHVTRKVYERTLVPPDQTQIRIRLLDTEQVQDPEYVLYFSCNRTLSPSAVDFDDKLFSDLNLLQENVGAVNYLHAEPTEAALLGLVYVNWELLPPGTRDVTLAAILSRVGKVDDTDQGILTERYDFLQEHNPVSWIVGSGQFGRYFGAIFSGRVLLENLRYGNALYVMPLDQWEELSKLSRTKLIEDRLPAVRRIPHRGGWQKTVAEIIDHADD